MSFPPNRATSRGETRGQIDEGMSVHGPSNLALPHTRREGTLHTLSRTAKVSVSTKTMRNSSPGFTIALLHASSEHVPASPKQVDARNGHAQLWAQKTGRHLAHLVEHLEQCVHVKLRRGHENLDSPFHQGRLSDFFNKNDTHQTRGRENRLGIDRKNDDLLHNHEEIRSEVSSTI